MWHMTCDTWHVTCDTWHVTHDRWGGEPSLKIPAPQLLQFGSEGVLKIWMKRLTHLITWLISNGGVYRTAPSSPGLFNIYTSIYIFRNLFSLLLDIFQRERKGGRGLHGSDPNPNIWGFLCAFVLAFSKERWPQSTHLEDILVAWKKALKKFNGCV